MPNGMTEGVTRVLLYDRTIANPVHRLEATKRALAAAGNGLELDTICRPKPFPGEPDAETALTQESNFGYNAVIIHGDAVDANKVLEAALFGYELRGQTPRIIYLSADGNLPPEAQVTGVQVVQTTPNGYLDERTAPRVVRAITTRTGRA